MLLFAGARLALANSSFPPVGLMGVRPTVSPKGGQHATCLLTSGFEVSGRSKGELRDADVYRSVYRHISRCKAPIIAKYGVAGR